METIKVRDKKKLRNVVSIKLYCLIILICVIILINHIVQLLLIGKLYCFHLGPHMSWAQVALKYLLGPRP